jgi:hypothetical protein
MAIFKPWQGTGDPTLRWRRASWIVLIAYRALKPFLGQKRVIAILQDVLSRKFKKNMHEYLEHRFGITQDAPEDAFDHIAQNYKLRGEQLFGPDFVYVQAVQESNQSFTHINKCLFNDFFRAHGAPELTTIFCILDSVWIDELHKPSYKIRFERPTTLARGDDACRFQFSKTTADQQALPEEE